MWVRSMAIVGAMLLCAGCMNITARVTPEQTEVPAVRESNDCVPILFGLSYGIATVEKALATKVIRLADAYDGPRARIEKVRSIALHDYQFLFFGARCVEVVGE